MVLDKNYKPVKHSAPFYFHHKGIEYCLGTAVTDDVVQMFVDLGSRDLAVRDLQRPFAEKPGVHPGDIVILPLILAASKTEITKIAASSK